MIKGLLRQELVPPQQIVASDSRPERLEELVQRYAVRPTGDNKSAAAEADVVVLSVKPQVVPKVLAELRGVVRADALVLSIAAGVPTATIAAGLGTKAVVRAMPNTPAQIGMGMTVWTATPGVTEAQKGAAQMILSALGAEVYSGDEGDLDRATALSGTGPAYVFLFMEALVDAGVHLGFSRHVAEKLVLQTLRGSVEYAIQSAQHLAGLRNQVTSPGGTTAAALYQLEKGGLRTVLSRAIWAAYQRSVALGRGETSKGVDLT
jgi:pyrroline-5-carboxylate reductase